MRTNRPGSESVRRTAASTAPLTRGFADGLLLLQLRAEHPHHVGVHQRAMRNGEPTDVTRDSFRRAIAATSGVKTGTASRERGRNTGAARMRQTDGRTGRTTARTQPRSRTQRMFARRVAVSRATAPVPGRCARAAALRQSAGIESASAADSIRFHFERMNCVIDLCR